MIYTSYFAKLKSLPDNIVPISICGKAPDCYKGLQYKKLAPKYDFFKKWKETHDNDYYIKCFNEQVLDKLDAMSVYQELCSLAKSDDIALICYEKPSDFCHRHLVANWLREQGFDIEEYDFAKQKGDLVDTALFSIENVKCRMIRQKAAKTITVYEQNNLTFL